MKKHQYFVPFTLTSTLMLAQIAAEITSSSQEETVCKPQIKMDRQCNRTAESCEERCNLHGTQYLVNKCCVHEGIAANLLAFEEDDLWVDRLREFNECTGGGMRLSYNPGGEDNMANDLINDVGGMGKPGSNIYDAYIVQAPWMPSVIDGLADMNDLIAKNQDTINWLDINPMSRSSVSYNNKVKALPLDSDYIAFGYRQDVFDKYEINNIPETIDELVELSEFLNGKDHNNDGVPDWGFCLTPQANYVMAFVAPMLQTHLRECKQNSDGIRVCDGSHTEQNIFFDANTFTPLIDNKGFKHAVKMYQRFLMASNCQSQTGGEDSNKAYCNRKTAVPTGRCAGVISMPGTMTKLLQNGKYDVAEGAPDGPLFMAPLPGFDDTKYWGRRIVFPGSSKVWNPNNGSDGNLEDCTIELCPKARPSVNNPERLVNYAPFFSEGGESYALNKASKPKQNEGMWDLFAWLADFGREGLNSDLVPLGGKYRLSHIKDPSKISGTDTKEVQMEKDLNTLLQLYFAEDTRGHGNAVQDLLMIGFSEYMAALDEELHDNFLLVKGKGFKDFTNDSASFDDIFNEFRKNLASKYQDITSKYGHLKQLQRWRESLCLPEKTDEALCAMTLMRDDSLNKYWTSDKLCSKFVLRDLCATQRKAVIAFQPNACRSEGAESSMGVKITVFTMGGVALAAAVIVLVWTYVHRNHPIVRASQVTFLNFIIFGYSLSILTLFFMPIEGSNVACMIQPWLFCIGFAITFSGLLLKTWRIKKIVDDSVQCKRIILKETDLIKWTGVILLPPCAILLCWTLLSPMVWYDNGIDAPRCALSHPLDSYNPLSFTIPLILFILMSYLCGNIIMYQARFVETVFAERQHIQMAMFANLEIYLIGVPIIIVAAGESPNASLLVKAGIVWLNGVTMMGFLFIPKMHMVTMMDINEARSLIRQAMTSSVQKKRSTLDRKKRSTVYSASSKPSFPTPSMSYLPSKHCDNNLASVFSDNGSKAIYISHESTSDIEFSPPSTK